MGLLRGDGAGAVMPGVVGAVGNGRRTARILLIAETDTVEQRFLSDTLRLAGHAITEASDPEGVSAALGAILAPEIVVAQAEAVRGGSTVADFVHALRAVSDVPLLLVTRRPDEDEELLALHAGADGYLARTMTAARLHAHVAAQLRRLPGDGAGTATELVWDDVRIDTRTREVRSGGEPLDLTRTEFDLLCCLVAAAGAILERERLLHLVWGSETYDGHVLDVYVSRLRRKLRDAGARLDVATVRGVGFRVA